MENKVIKRWEAYIQYIITNYPNVNNEAVAFLKREGF